MVHIRGGRRRPGSGGRLAGPRRRAAPLRTRRLAAPAARSNARSAQARRVVASRAMSLFLSRVCEHWLLHNTG